jgi:hypothetical protein
LEDQLTRKKASNSDETAEHHSEKHGLCMLKKGLKRLGNRAIDQRTRAGKTLTEWQAEIISDLGGTEELSAQQLAILNLVTKTKWLLESVDAWLVQQPSLVNHRKRCLFPIVLQRQQLADALARYLQILGLERKAKRVPSLIEYLEAKEDKK